MAQAKNAEIWVIVVIGIHSGTRPAYHNIRTLMLFHFFLFFWQSALSLSEVISGHTYTDLPAAQEPALVTMSHYL